MRIWQLQEAKAHMSELVKQAQKQPQAITVHGKSAAVVLSARDYERLTRKSMPFTELMRRSPLYGSELEFPRDRSPVREVVL